MDKRHLVISLAVLLASIVYNVWVFTRPAPASARPAGPAPVDQIEPVTPGSEPGAAVDPLQVLAPPPVALDRAPEWPRNPFVGTAVERVPDVVEAVAPEPVMEAEPVLASILHSSARRLAVIDGRVVGLGDRVGSAVVADILPDAVVLDSPLRGRRRIELKAPRTSVAAGIKKP